MNAPVRPEAPSWEPPRTTPEIDDQAVMARWKAATAAVCDVAAKEGWSKSEVSRRADVAIGTFSGWYDGTYKGRYDTTTLRIENFLESRRAAVEASRGLPVSPGFIQTRVARELFAAFRYAQLIPTMAVITIASGLGKSMAARAFRNSIPHVHHVTLSPSSGNAHSMKSEIAQEIGVVCRDTRLIKKAITDVLRREGFTSLLIIDEAQNLTEDCVNELRHFRDMANCGLVLLGNEEGKTPYASRDAKNGSAQVARRVGHRLNIMKPYEEDIALYVDAWGLTDPAARDMAMRIARMPGAFGTLHETILTAGMIAAGHDRGITAADMQAAWSNRGAGAVK